MSDTDNTIEKPEIQEKNQASEYSVYDYFYDKPAVLLTFVTAMMSLISFLFSFLIVAFRNQRLSYWGLDNYTTTGVIISFSVFSILFVFGLLFSLCNFIITSSSDAFICNTFFFLGFRKKIDENKKMILKTQKLLLNARETTKSIDNWNCRKEEVEWQLRENKKTKKELQSLYRTASLVEFVKSLSVSIAVMWSSFILVIKILPVFIEFRSFAIIILQYTLSYHLTILLLETVFFLVFQRKELQRQKSSERDEDFIDAFRRFPFIRLGNFRFRECFRNSNIKSFFRTCLLSLCVVLVTFVIITEVGIQQQKDFDIVDVNGNQVAVILRNNDTCYGNRIVIMDNMAYISKTEHEIMKTESYSFTSYSFSEVIRVDSLSDVFESAATPVEEVNEAAFL